MTSLILNPLVRYLIVIFIWTDARNSAIYFNSRV